MPGALVQAACSGFVGKADFEVCGARRRFKALCHQARAKHPPPEPADEKVRVRLKVNDPSVQQGSLRYATGCRLQSHQPPEGRSRSDGAGAMEPQRGRTQGARRLPNNAGKPRFPCASHSAAPGGQEAEASVSAALDEPEVIPPRSALLAQTRYFSIPLPPMSAAAGTLESHVALAGLCFPPTIPHHNIPPLPPGPPPATFPSPGDPMPSIHRAWPE